MLLRRSRILVVAIGLFLGPASACSESKPESKWHDYWAQTDNPRRDRDPATAKILATIDARAGHRVVDLGAGAGYFTFKLAKVVGRSGRIVALDVAADVIGHIVRVAAVRGLPQVTARSIPTTEPGLEQGSYDRIFMVDVYPSYFNVDQTPVAQDVLTHLRRALASDGKLVIYQSRTPGPDQRIACDGPTSCEALDAPGLVRVAKKAGLVVHTLERFEGPTDPGFTPGFLVVFKVAQPDAGSRQRHQP